MSGTDQSKLAAYQRTQQVSDKPSADADPREIEAWALTRSAHELQAAMRRRHEDRRALQSALMKNQRLWTILQGDLAQSKGRLPEDLRRNLLALSIFIDKQTVARLIDLDVEQMHPLISININLAAGLREGLNNAAGAAAEVAHETGAHQAAFGGRGQGQGQGANPYGGQPPTERITISA